MRCRAADDDTVSRGGVLRGCTSCTQGARARHSGSSQYSDRTKKTAATPHAIRSCRVSLPGLLESRLRTLRNLHLAPLLEAALTKSVMSTLDSSLRRQFITVIRRFGHKKKQGRLGDLLVSLRAMGASVSVGSKKTPKPPTQDPETPAAESRKLPERGMLRVLGFNRNPLPLLHDGSWLEVTVFEAKDLPAADDNGTVHVEDVQGYPALSTNERLTCRRR